VGRYNLQIPSFLCAIDWHSAVGAIATLVILRIGFGFDSIQLFQVYTLPWIFYKLCVLKGSSHYRLKKSSEPVLLFGSTDVVIIKEIAKTTRYPFREVLSCTYASAIRRCMLETLKVGELPKFLGAGVALPALRYTRSFDMFANRA